MNLSGLLPLLQHLAPFTELTERLARNEAPAEPQAIYHAARAYVTAGLRQHLVSRGCRAESGADSCPMV